MAIELYENKDEHYILIKDGTSVLKLTEEQFKTMSKMGLSPLLQKLWEQAKKERAGSLK
ncbi:MAG: hypothetical protein V1744_00940 [Candidatus Altiarchaeota archaeon]